MNQWVQPVGEPAQESTKHLKSITRADKRLLSTYMHLIGSLEIVELGKRAIDMDFVATADSSAGTSVYEEDNLADRVDLARHTRGGHFLIIKAAAFAARCPHKRSSNSNASCKGTRRGMLDGGRVKCESLEQNATSTMRHYPNSSVGDPLLTNMFLNIY